MDPHAERASAEILAGASCANCGAPALGPFCTQCGEDLRPATERSLSARLRRARDADVRQPSYLRTFLTLITRPGQLTADFLAGRRRRYLRPLQVFLWCNVVYFFGQPLVHMNMLSTPLHIHMSDVPYAAWASGLVNEAVARRGLEWNTYRVIFDTTLDHLARTLVIVMVPMLAALLAVLFRRSATFAGHTIFALHFYAFGLLSALLFPLLNWALYHALRPFIAPEVLVQVLDVAPFAIWWIYLYFALQRVYRQPRSVTALKTAVLAGLLIVVLTVYRFILFLVTFYSV